MVGLKKLLGGILREEGIITEDQIRKTLEIQKREGGLFGEILIAQGFATRRDVVRALGIQYGMEVVELDKMEIPTEVIDQVSVTIAQAYRIIPILYEDGVLTVAMADPSNIAILDDLKFFLDMEVRGCISDEEAIARAFEQYYSGKTESVSSIISELEKEDFAVPVTTSPTETIDLESIEEMTESAPVRKLLNLVLLQAIRDHASDVHFEPFEDEFKIRYRIDGVLYEMVPPPRHLSLAITSRLKVMSNLDIAERRLPQDGRIELNVGGNPVDLRVSVVPTMFGESVVLRILDRSVAQLDLDKLGLRENDLIEFKKTIRKPQGIVLVTGPTGCGKTTTLYAALNDVNDVEVKIVTTEDPIEYSIDGIIQIQINPEAGVTFANCLRHILRHDPDKILVGEIRDFETAQIAIQASLTGHVVFSTLHTNDSPSTITRLIDIGVEPYLITATVEQVISERLVRVICTKCKTPYKPSREELMELNLTEEQAHGKVFYYGNGCPLCNNTGYKGRKGVFEVMNLDEELSELVMSKVSTATLREAAIRKGMRTLRDAGLLDIYDGITTVDEIIKVTIGAED